MSHFWNALFFRKPPILHEIWAFGIFLQILLQTHQNHRICDILSPFCASKSVSTITQFSSNHHNIHIEKKAACNCTDRPYAVWSRILLLNFCNSIDIPQGNQCRAWSIVIVQYTFTTSHRKISFDSSVWNCQWTYKNRAVCLSILIIPKQFDIISITGIILQILLLYHFR